MLIYFLSPSCKIFSREIIVTNLTDIMNIIFKKQIVRRSYPNIHLHIMFGRFIKSASILTDQDTQMVMALTHDWQLFGTLCLLTLEHEEVMQPLSMKRRCNLYSYGNGVHPCWVNSASIPSWIVNSTSLLLLFFKHAL